MRTYMDVALSKDIQSQSFWFFHTETQIVASAREREESMSLVKASSRSDLRQTLLMKMKSVTNADESICISLLESNSFDLKTSIEAYFSTT